MNKVSRQITTFLPWTDIEEGARKQIVNTSLLPFLFKWVAVMPDCHFGKGATVGTVMATQGAIVPAAVGVDIGCGMIAVETALRRGDLASLHALREDIERRIPMSAGRNNRDITLTAEARIAELKRVERATGGDYAAFQRDWELALGTLGGGNHFVEVCLDENDAVWLTLHSGSRGVGNRIGNHYIRAAQEICNKKRLPLPDRDLAYLTEGTEEFDNYLRDLKWAQLFARLNREEMMDRVLAATLAAASARGADAVVAASGDASGAAAGSATLGPPISRLAPENATSPSATGAATSDEDTPSTEPVVILSPQQRAKNLSSMSTVSTHQPIERSRINCHHNFTQIETHFGREVWITRKGAIEAREGMQGMIPGSMGTHSYIVTGLGNADAFQSAPHGAGRSMSRTKARATHTMHDLETAMNGIEYRKSHMLVDEIPAAYKNIDQVIANASELIRVDHTLRQIINCKGD